MFSSQTFDVYLINFLIFFFTWSECSGPIPDGDVVACKDSVAYTANVKVSKGGVLDLSVG